MHNYINATIGCGSICLLLYYALGQQLSNTLANCDCFIECSKMYARILIVYMHNNKQYNIYYIYTYTLKGQCTVYVCYEAV